MELMTLRQRLELYLAAERAIVGGAKRYKVGDRELERADLGEIRKAIQDLQEAIKLAEGRYKRVKAIEL